MSIFLDRTGSKFPPLIRSPKPSRRDFLLWCDGCKKPAAHSFDGIQPAGINTIHIVYECTRCGEQRQFGRENADGRESRDSDTDDNTDT